MFFRQLTDPAFAQLSYVIGCRATGEAVVVDPVRDVDQYIDLAAREGFRIATVTETHIHDDYCSGARELAFRTGASLLLSGCGDESARYEFAQGPCWDTLVEGNTIRIGNVRLSVLHTPGHAPEHIAFLVSEQAASNLPVGLLCGDFLCVGDVPWPEHFAGADPLHSAEARARTHFKALQRLRTLPDHLQLWPAHQHGTTTVRAPRECPQSTLGYERRTNWALRVQDDDEFVRTLLADMPVPQPYFAVVKAMNRVGPVVLGGLPDVPHRSGYEAQLWHEKHGLVVDARDESAFALAHLDGSLSVPGNATFASWFASLIRFDTDIWLLVDDERQGVRLVRELMAVGFDRITGVSLAADALDGAEPAQLCSRSAQSLSGAIGRPGLTVLDVRTEPEWAAGHLAGALHIPLGELPQRLEELPLDGTLISVCSDGARSVIAASLLLLAGATSVENLSGGMEAWRDIGGPLSTDAAPAQPRERRAGVATAEIPPFLDRRCVER